MIKKIIVLLSISSLPLNAKNLSYASYEVLFTQTKNSTQELTKTPDLSLKITKWLTDDLTKQIFISAYNLTNNNIIRSICSKIKKNAQVTIVTDKNSPRYSINLLQKCAQKTPNNLQVFFGSDSPDLQPTNTSLIILNYDSKHVNFITGSGALDNEMKKQLSAWHFIKQVPRDTFFVSIHSCFMRTQLEAARNASELLSAMSVCQSPIKYEEEDDIKTFFTPIDNNLLIEEVDNKKNKMTSIDLVTNAHHNTIFSSFLRKNNNIRLITTNGMTHRYYDSTKFRTNRVFM